jgi:hypothetical protein
MSELEHARQDHDPPEVVQKENWRYHHLGIPTNERREGERHLPQFGMHVSGFETSRYGIEWLRFDEGSALPEIIRTVAHVAFEVEDLEAALAGREVIWPPGSPSDGVRSAMIIDNGAPVELICFGRRSGSGA